MNELNNVAGEEEGESRSNSDSLMNSDELTENDGIKLTGVLKKQPRMEAIKSNKNRKKSTAQKSAGLIAMNLDTKEETKKYMEKFLINELETLYAELDINGNEMLQAEEILLAFHEFGHLDVTLEECKMICEEITGQKDLNLISLHDFKAGMYDQMKQGTTDQQLKMVFDLMDYKQTGLVDPTGLVHLFAMVGLNMHPSEVFNYMDEIDVNKTGVFDFTQFKVYCAGIDLLETLKDRFEILAAQHL